MKTFLEFLEATFLYPDMDKVNINKTSKLSDFRPTPIDPKFSNWAKDTKLQPALNRLNDIRNLYLQVCKSEEKADQLMSDSRYRLIDTLIKEKLISPKLVTYLQKYFDSPKPDYKDQL